MKKFIISLLILCLCIGQVCFAGNSQSSQSEKPKAIELFLSLGAITAGTLSILYVINHAEETSTAGEIVWGVLGGLMILGGTQGLISFSIPMTVRDLVDLARSCGIDPAVSKKIAVDKFKKVNFVAHHLDPESGAINYTECVGGFKARSFADAKATGALDTTTIEGSPDLVIKGDGKVEIIEYIGDGSKTDFDLPAGATGVVAVESPKSVEVDTGWTYNAEGGATPATPYVAFDTAPDSNSVVRIYFTAA